MQKIHVDTDLGGDIDDLCALALLLRWPEVEITGITTVAEAAGRRAGYVRHALALAAARNIPVAAGADVAGGYYRYSELGYPDEERYWSQRVPPSPNPLDEGLDLIERSIERGASVVAIGPYTNLRLLEERRPGILMQTELTLMGGYVYRPRAEYPQMENEEDWNIQVDIESARYVMARSRPLLVPLTITVETALRRRYLRELRKAGPLGALIASQAEAFAADESSVSRFGSNCSGLPSDIINFQHDPLACAIALGWRDGVTIEQRFLCIEEQDGYLWESSVVEDKIPRGTKCADRQQSGLVLASLVTQIDGPRFSELWLRRVSAR